MPGGSSKGVPAPGKHCTRQVGPGPRPCRDTPRSSLRPGAGAAGGRPPPARPSLPAGLARTRSSSGRSTLSRSAQASARPQPAPRTRTRTVGAHAPCAPRAWPSSTHPRPAGTAAWRPGQVGRPRCRAAPSRRPPQAPGSIWPAAPSRVHASRAPGGSALLPLGIRRPREQDQPAGTPPARSPAHRLPSPRRRPSLQAPLSLGAPGAGRPHGAGGAVAAGPVPHASPPAPKGPGLPRPTAGGVWPSVGAVVPSLCGCRSALLTPLRPLRHRERLPSPCSGSTLSTRNSTLPQGVRACAARAP